MKGVCRRVSHKLIVGTQKFLAEGGFSVIFFVMIELMDCLQLR